MMEQRREKSLFSGEAAQVHSKFSHWLAIVVFISGCTAIGTMQLEQRYGKAQPRERVVESLPPNTIDYWGQVKPIVAQRCVVCHGCYDAPCQLKMSSIEGIERGANSAKVYKPARIKAAPPTRLIEDAEMRRALSGRAYGFAQETFGRAHVFGALQRLLDWHSRRQNTGDV
jgi:hypothetical protein